MAKATVILATVGLGMYLWYNVWNKLIHERMREADMGDDARLAEVQHEDDQRVSSPAKLLIWLGCGAVCWGWVWLVVWGVARAIDMRR